MQKDKISKSPIGVFDSGLGGLTVVKQLIKHLPNEDIVYFGDTARVPYGSKSKESIIKFSVENAKVLLRNNVKMIVVACNSSSSYAIPTLEKKFKVPIIDVISPGAKKAVLNTSNNKVGVIATSATIASGSYNKAISRINKRISISTKACPLFVPLIEEGWSGKKVSFDIAKEYLGCLKKNKVDTVILGCTHYPVMKDVIRKVMGKNVFLVDSAREVAEEVNLELKAKGIENLSTKKKSFKFIISDRPQAFKKIAKRFLGIEIKKVVMI